MTITSSYPVTVDSIGLHTLAWSIETKEGRDIMPAVKDSNLDVGATHGDLWVPNKKYGPGKFYLKMWVAGQDADGVVPADNYKKYRDNLDQLLLLFTPRYRKLDVRQQLDKLGTSIRQAYMETTAIIDPSRVANNPYTSKFVVELTNSDAFWQDVTDKNYDSGLAVTNNTVATLTEFLGATAEMTDLWVVVDGPAASGTKVLDETTGHFIQLVRTLSSTEQWVINTTDYTSKVGTGIAFTSGGVDEFGRTLYGGNHNPALFGLTPRVGGAPQVRIQGTGFGANTRLRIRGKRKYL